MYWLRFAYLLWLAGFWEVLGSLPASCCLAPPGDMVYWRAGRPLRWNDFQAHTCLLPAKASERTVGACSATAITVLPCTDQRGRSTFRVDSYFIRSRSWVRDSTRYDNRLVLLHEQVHFNINELYARKIREAVAAYYQANRYPFGADLHEHIALLLLQKNACNSRFDAEAAADAIGGSVGKWQATVQQQLQELAPYEAGSCPCGW